MSGACPECGAALADGASCQALFHALLALEGEVPGGPGEIAHFYAVASYGVQHPGSMGYTAGTLAGLRDALAAVLDGRSTLEDVRRRVRYQAREAGRVTRRTGDAVPGWDGAVWPMTVAWALAGGPTEYGARVEAWARSVVTALDARKVR